MIKKVIINILLLLLVLCMLEFYARSIQNVELVNFANNYNKNANAKLMQFKYGRTIEYNPSLHINMLRPVNNGDFNKKSVIFIGCSYTYGTLLKNTETLPYLVSQLSGRTTYNFGQEGAGPQTILYNSEHSNIYNKAKNSDYIIYTFIGDHRN